MYMGKWYQLLTVKNDNIKRCYYFPLYIFCVIIYVIIYVIDVIIFHGQQMLSFLCYHLCYHLMLSFIVIISPLFSFSWKHNTLGRGGGDTMNPKAFFSSDNMIQTIFPHAVPTLLLVCDAEKSLTSVCEPAKYMYSYIYVSPQYMMPTKLLYICMAMSAYIFSCTLTSWLTTCTSTSMFMMGV